MPPTTIDDEAVWNRIWELQGKREEGSVTADQLYDLWPDLKTAKLSYKRRLNSLVADGWVVKIGEGRTMSYRAVENQRA